MALLGQFFAHKSGLYSAILFSALFALLELGGALSFSVAEAMFISGLGVESLPLAYILLFAVMAGAMSLIAYAQSKFTLDKVLGGLLAAFLVFVLTMALCFGFFEPSGFFKTVLLYFLKLGAAVWVYASFSLYWNFADEHFNIREGKRLYAVFSAFGCVGAVAGSGAVFVFSEYLKIETGFLLWIWALAIVLALPVFRLISKNCPRLDSGVSFEDSTCTFKEVIATNISAMTKSPYVRALFALYLFVIFAAVLNEFSVMSAFSDYSNAGALLEFAGEPEKIKEAGQLKLASILGALGIGVNVFNFAVNMFFFNKLAARFGVGNLAALQPLCYIVAFVWLVNSFGMPAAVFSFFMYRGVMESIDANNANLMISVLPSSFRQQVRLFVESFMVPFSTALAGFFLMFYAKGESSFDFSKNKILADIAETLGFGSLSITGICIFGFFTALLGLWAALALRRRYPKVLEGNLRAESLDFSASMESLLQKNSADISGGFSTKNRCGAQLVAYLEIESVLNPANAAKVLLENAHNFGVDEQKQVEGLLYEIAKSRNFEVAEILSFWLLKSANDCPKWILNALKRADFLTQLALLKNKNFAEINSESAAPKPADLNLAMGEFEKLESLRRFDPKSAKIDEIFDFIYDESAKVSALAFEVLSQNPSAINFEQARKLAAMFKNANTEIAPLILDALSNNPDPEILNVLLEGLAKVPQALRRRLLEFLSSMDVVAVPELVFILRSDRFSYAVKSACAVGLFAIFPAQLKILASEIFENEIRNAYTYSVYEDTVPEALALAAVLRWRRRECVSFILLIFSLCGKVSAYESLENAIFSSVGKGLATAIESLEQSLKRSEFRQILPLIDGRKNSEIAKLARARYGLKVSEDDVLNWAVCGVFDEDFLAGATRMLVKNPECLPKILCAKIASLNGGKLRDMLLDFFDSLATLALSFPPPEPSILHKFSALNMCGYFEGFEPSALVELALISNLAAKTFTAKSESIVVYFNENLREGADYKILCAGQKTEFANYAMVLDFEHIFKVAKNYPESAVALFRKAEEL